MVSRQGTEEAMGLGVHCKCWLPVPLPWGQQRDESCWEHWREILPALYPIYAVIMGRYHVKYAAVSAPGLGCPQHASCRTWRRKKALQQTVIPVPWEIFSWDKSSVRTYSPQWVFFVVVLVWGVFLWSFFFPVLKRSLGWGWLKSCPRCKVLAAKEFPAPASMRG